MTDRRPALCLLIPLATSAALHGFMLAAPLAPAAGPGLLRPALELQLSLPTGVAAAATEAAPPPPTETPSQPQPAPTEAGNQAATAAQGSTTAQGTALGGGSAAGQADPGSLLPALAAPALATSPLSAPSLLLPYLTAAEVDQRAIPIDPPPLVLPEAVLRQRLHGKVELRIFIAASGRVDAVEVIDSSHPGLLEEAALETARATRFSPAYKAGRAVRSLKHIEVVFDPDEPGQAEAGEDGSTGPPVS